MRASDRIAELPAGARGSVGEVVLRSGVVMERQDSGLYAAEITRSPDPLGELDDVRAMDLGRYRDNPVVLYGHDPYALIGRTESLEWESDALVARFEFLPGDAIADRARNAWDRGFLRGASIGFVMWRDGDGLQHSELMEWSAVVVPADAKALKRHLIFAELDYGIDSNASTGRGVAEEAEMVSTRASDDAAVAERAADEEMEAADGGLDREEMSTMPHMTVDLATGEEADAELADAEREEYEDDGDGDGDDDASEIVTMGADEIVKRVADKVVVRAEGVAAAAEREIELRVRYAPLMPAGFTQSEHTLRAVLESAVGREVDDVAERSEDYLLGAADMILKRRAGAMRRSLSKDASGSGGAVAPVDVTYEEVMWRREPSDTEG